MQNSLAQAIRKTSKLSGTFVLRSGAISDTYFDKYLFESDPTLLREIAEHMAALVPKDTEILCGLEMGGLPVVTVLGQVTGLACAFIRKDRKSYGTMKYAEGPELKGRKVVIVEDVVSNGGAILAAAEKLRSDGVVIANALCVIDRQTGGAEKLLAAGVQLSAVLTMEQVESAG